MSNTVNANTKEELKKETAPINTEGKSLAEPVVSNVSASVSEGMNLIPKKTVAEVKVEKKKSTFNLGSVLALIALVTVTLGIVGFNIVSKVQLNNKKSELYSYEKVLGEKIDIISANNSIVDRVVMYQKVEDGRFSHKEVVQFLEGVLNKAGNLSINSLEISDGLSIEFSGTAPSFEEVSKLWYLLGVNDKVETVNLDSVGKGENDARFSFTAQLNSKEFID